MALNNDPDIRPFKFPLLPIMEEKPLSFSEMFKAEGIKQIFETCRNAGDITEIKWIGPVLDRDANELEAPPRVVFNPPRMVFIGKPVFGIVEIKFTLKPPPAKTEL
jgi:hypothetical protein